MCNDDDSRFPQLGLLSACREPFVVVSRAGDRASSSSFNQFGREGVVEFAAEGAGCVFGHGDRMTIDLT